MCFVGVQNGLTPLFTAVRFGHLPAISALLELGASVDVRAPPATATAPRDEGTAVSGVTPLLHALDSTDYHQLAQTHHHHHHSSQPPTTKAGSPLHAGASLTSSIVRLLCEHGASIHARDSRSTTALMYALRSGDRSSAALVVGLGADVEARDDLTQQTALMQLIVRLIDDLNCTPPSSSPVPTSAPTTGPPITASGDHHPHHSHHHHNHHHSHPHTREERDAIRWLVEHCGADLNTRDGRTGLTPLMLAVRANQLDLVRWFITIGADPQFVSSITDLSSAVSSAAPGLPAVPPPTQQTALMMACGSAIPIVHRLPLVRCLIESGSPVDTTTATGETALLVAARTACLESAGSGGGGGAAVAAGVAIISVLIEAGANINTRDEDGQTVLMKSILTLATAASPTAASVTTTSAPPPASAAGVELIRSLLSFGCDASISDSSGCTALHHARLFGSFDIAQLIARSCKAEAVDALFAWMIPPGPIAAPLSSSGATKS